MRAGTLGNKVLLTVLHQKKTESSERQSRLGSSSKPDLTCFDSAFVAMYVSCVFVFSFDIVMLRLVHCYRIVSAVILRRLELMNVLAQVLLSV